MVLSVSGKFVWYTYDMRNNTTREKGFYIEMKQKITVKRVMMCVIGVLICGISVGFFKVAALGVDPFQSLMSGLDAVIPISFGTLYVLANLVLLTFSLIADQHFIGLATFINLFLLGYVAEYSQAFLESLFPDMGVALRVVMLVIGVVVMCMASALYFTADLGVSTYDSVALIISKTWKKMEFSKCRILCDLTCVVLGSLLCVLSSGGVSALTAAVGVGTIITAFFMGPLISFFNVHLAEPILYGKK